MHLLFLLLILPLVCADRLVMTNSGPVKGTSLAPKRVEAFLGIPYAEPPVGPLRFAKPIPKSSWTETYDASELPPACVQAVLESFIPQSNMKEDCLYLNLWIPEGGGNLKPILVFIHGGGFMLQSSNLPLYDGAKLSEHGNVIVASINYRVGTLGFFSGFIEDAAGNMGMHDQVMAIQWIKDNAKHFGGDPDNIVLFGESAGAFSISLHMVSPLSKDLFKRGILQSGSAFHPMCSDDNKLLFRGSSAIANFTGCADSNEALKYHPESVVECMKNLPAQKFSEADLLYLQRNGQLIPRVGDDFLPKNPIDLIRDGKSKDAELLLGVNRNEGSLLLSLFRQDMFGFFGDRVNPGSFNETSARNLLQSMLKVEGVSRIIQGYLDKVKRRRRYSYLQAMSDVVGDYLITCGAVFEADFKSQENNPVYFYRFDYRSPSSPFAEWVGVTHTEELPYVFGNTMFQELNTFEEGLSKHIMDMWIAFAKTGNPSIAGGLEWPRYTYGGGKYFIIGQRDRVCRRPDNNRCRVWRHIFRSYVKF